MHAGDYVLIRHTVFTHRAWFESSLGPQTHGILRRVFNLLESLLSCYASTEYCKEVASTSPCVRRIVGHTAGWAEEFVRLVNFTGLGYSLQSTTDSNHCSYLGYLMYWCYDERGMPRFVLQELRSVGSKEKNITRKTLD